LTDSHELILVGLVRAFSMAGIPLSPIQIMDIARNQFKLKKYTWKQEIV